MKFKVYKTGNPEPIAAFNHFYDAHTYCKFVISDSLKPISQVGSFIYVVYDDHVLASEYSHDYTQVYFKSPKEVK